MGDEMKRTWLVQRLNAPQSFRGGDNPFAFGGGFKNGGLSDDAMGLLRGVWSFDYMGSAEFEFGAVPNALSGLAGSDLSAFQFDIVEKNRRDKSAKKPIGSATVYVICPVKWKKQVEDRIRDIAAGLFRLKESSRFPQALNPVEKWDTETRGWLELDNGFLFFVDQPMWESAATLFGVAS